MEIYHLKAAGRRNWPKAEAAIARIAAARARGLDVGADMYPYVAGSTGLTAVLPPSASAGGKLFDRLADPAERARIRAEVLEQKTEWENMGQLATPRASSSSGSKSLKTGSTSASGSPRLPAPRASTGSTRDGPDPLRAPEHRHGLFHDERGEPQAPVASALDQVRHRCRGAGPRSPQVLTHPCAYGTFPRILGATCARSA